MLRRFLIGTATSVPIIATWMGANASAALKETPRCGDCGEIKEPHELWMHHQHGAGPNVDGHMHCIDLCDACLCVREDGFANKQDYDKALAEHEARRVLKIISSKA